ncbi:hypothetical protein HK103_003680 [Boothiomyces macroporosus]|uniref:Uncharacterized protein n=1 Tax=Boothiomyces macroporosus TaxID=261099 RepID=A0AAD5UI42_9FUNG|nr:hypothetical protein HK103_003680 [Boothiomyces macroporosus]
MSEIEFADALYSIQSQWLHSECVGPPDVIVGSPNISNTIPFGSLVWSGPTFCDNEWLVSCSHPGICSASLSLDLTAGYQSFQDSYLYHVPTSPDEWLFPIGASNSLYCQITGGNTTSLLLTGSTLCYNNFQCSDNELRYFNQSGCVGNYTRIPLTKSISLIPIGNAIYQSAMYSVSKGTESIIWTTYITSSYLFLPSEPLWIISLVLVLVSLTITFIHMGKALVLAYNSKNERRIRYLVYFLGFILTMGDVITAFLSYISGTMNPVYNDLIFGIDSGFNIALNGWCLMEIVFTKKPQRWALSFVLGVLFIAFGLPFVFYTLYVNDNVTPFGIWLVNYFDVVCYPVWQILYIAMDPMTAGTIIFYIINKSLDECDKDVLGLLWIMFSDVQLIMIAGVSFLNFAICVFLQLATTYTLFAQSDKHLMVYLVVFSIQHSINSCCTLWYATYFPAVLLRMKSLKKSIKANKNLNIENAKSLKDSEVSDTKKPADSDATQKM